MNSTWELELLGKILKERRETPELADVESGRVRIVSKISFSKGKLELRNDAKTKTEMILIRPGDLVVSGINAEKGAIAIWDSDHLESIAATIHYSAYSVKCDIADPLYLWWYLRSNAFREILRATLPKGIKTELKPSRFLSIEIPIPPLEKQRDIASKVMRVSAQITESSVIRARSRQLVNQITGAYLQKLTAHTDSSSVLGAYLLEPPQNGWSARCDNMPEGTPVLSLSAITGYKYRKTEFKRTSLPADPDAHYWLKPGDILITRSNSPELVGHAAIYDGTPSPCIYSDLMMRLEPDVTRIDRKFLWYWLQSRRVRDFVQSHAKGTSPSMKKISQSTVRNIPFPRELTIEEQRNVVIGLDRLTTKIEQVSTFQKNTAAELQSVLPSVLDKAFKGEL